MAIEITRELFTAAEKAAMQQRAKEIVKSREEMKKYLTPEQFQLLTSIDRTLNEIKLLHL